MPIALGVTGATVLGPKMPCRTILPPPPFTCAKLYLRDSCTPGHSLIRIVDHRQSKSASSAARIIGTLIPDEQAHA